MCGIAGYWTLRPDESAEMNARVAAMAARLRHRGPDDGGEWVDSRAGLALGFRRLAIQDLTPEGHQPMVSASGRYVITFNGEIYNFTELRDQLREKGAFFRGHSDTEVILAAIEQWGVTKAMRAFNGMFAIALWDRQGQVLHLARDPLGIKPLYFGFRSGTLFWASELRALRECPDFIPEIDQDAAALYLRHGYVPAPFSIYRGVYKLEPGCILKFRRPDAAGVTDRFWSAQQVAVAGQADPFQGTDEEAIHAMEAVLRRSIVRQMAADVPLGAFLSGGIDSSLVVALMQAESSNPVQSFSIGYAEDAFNEAGHAAAVARHLGTEHHEWIVSPRDALNQIGQIAEICDEPFADPALIPTCLVAQLARKKVTVSLSGDGGDEVFGGYYYHGSAHEGPLAQALRWPGPARRAIGIGLSAMSAGLRQASGRRLPRIGAALRHRARYYNYDDPVRYYREHIADQFGQGDALARDRRNPAYLLTDWRADKDMSGVAEIFMLLDTLMMLPDQMLAKVDLATMGVSLEGRVPLLDTDVVALAWRLPMKMKIRDGQGKWILRRILSRHLPPTITERPKQGFGVPLADWLRGPLRDWAENLLTPRALKDHGLIDVELVTRLWHQHQTGSYAHTQLLWSVLMLQDWCGHWLELE